MSAATVLSPLTAFAETEEQELNIAIFQGGYGDAYWNQMVELFEESHEYGVHKGLGLIKGTVASIDEDLKKQGITDLKVPHIGWNALDFKADEPLFKYIKQGDCVYYVHSFYGRDCEESTIATSMYGIKITGAVRNGSVYGTQFHPEKSGDVGLNILRAFMEV